MCLIYSEKFLKISSFLFLDRSKYHFFEACIAQRVGDFKPEDGEKIYTIGEENGTWKLSRMDS